MTSRQHARARTAAARRIPSVPRRRRRPSPAGANRTDCQPRDGGWGSESVLSMRSSATPDQLPPGVYRRPGLARSSRACQDPGLLLLELGGGEDSLVAQFGEPGQLVGRAARARGLPDVSLEFLVLAPC